MSISRPPRVALGGIVLESNAFAPVATEVDFRSRFYFAGEALTEEVARPHSAIPREMAAFVEAMNRTGIWEPVPTLLTGFQPAGPVEHKFFLHCVETITARLENALPLDAVYLSQHGAMVSTETSDPDGLLVKAIRQVVGPDTHILATLDLHANLSECLIENTDLLVSYLTNPHVDMVPRGEEAAHMLRKLLTGTKPKTAFLRLPLTPPSVTLLTREGPYAEMIAYGQKRQQEFGGRILNVSICGGFVFSDTPKNGVAVVVTADEDLGAARRLCREIAELGWSQRERFQRTLTSIEEAINIAGQTATNLQAPAVIFSDAGDNPGGGGGGNTTWLLKALVEAQRAHPSLAKESREGLLRVLYGSFCDPELAAEAHAQGEGAEFEAVFNRAGETEFAKRFSIQARVLKLSDGFHIGRLGISAERSIEMGPSAALQIGGSEGVTVIVMTNRHQTADPIFFEAFGLDISKARTVVVKSRGHFRAGFEPWFAPEQVFEVDTPGLTAPVLERFDWKALPRPVYPLDAEVTWVPPDW